MNSLQLLPVGDIDWRVIETLRTGLLRYFRASCDVLDAIALPDYAFNAERQQYCSSEILNRMGIHAHRGCWRLLAITPVDLYIPILTFVFGEAQMGGPNAVISTFRLRQEFYGLPADRDLLNDRLLKEAVHELGHTLQLTHCRDYYCAMAPSHAVEWIDLKDSQFCNTCQEKVLARYVSVE